MDKTILERQRRFRKKLYSAGFKTYTVWVKKNEQKRTKSLPFTGFIKKLRKITVRGWNKEDLSSLYWLLLKIARGQKGVNRFRKTQ